MFATVYIQKKVFLMQLCESVKKLEFFRGFYSYLQFKLMILHKLIRQNNGCLNICFSVCKCSTEFISLCKKFDLAINHCPVIKM